MAFDYNQLCEFASPVTQWLGRNSKECAAAGGLVGAASGTITVGLMAVRTLSKLRKPVETVTLTAVPGEAASGKPPKSPERVMARRVRRGIYRGGAVTIAAGLFVAVALSFGAEATPKPEPAAPPPPTATPAAQPTGPAAPHPAGFAFGPLPAGTFPRGKRLEATLTEVTQAQFRAANIPGHVPHFSAAGKGSRAVAGLATDDFPVDASARQAEAFCADLAKQSAGRVYRLPTLAEFRALATAHPAPPSGSGLVLSRTKFDARTRPEAVGAPAPAGEFRHLFGNVAELVTTDGGGYAAVGGSYFDTPGAWLDAAGALKPIPYSADDRRIHMGFRVVGESAE